MESTECITSEDKINILKLCYDNIKIICGEAAVIESDTKTVLLDLDGNTIKEFGSNVEVIGSFILEYKAFKINIYNVLTGKCKEVNGRVYDVRTRDGELKTDYFLILSLNDGLSIFNIDLDVIEIPNAYRVYKVFKTTHGCKFNYSNGSSHGEISLNNLTGTYDYLDIAPVHENLVFLGTSVEKCRINYYSSTAEINDIVRYRVCYNGYIKGKEYSSFTPLRTLEGLYIKTFNVIGGKVYEGILDYKGDELIDTVFDSVEYFGNYNFILKRDNKVHLFNLQKGYLATNIDQRMFTRHESMPIALILTTNGYMVFDTKSRIYKVDDITKYYKCQRSTVDGNIIRFNLSDNEEDEVYVYCTSGLIPMHNRHMINKLKAEKWVDV